MNKCLALASLLLCSYLIYPAWGDFALNNSISGDPLGDIMNRINGVVCIFFSIILYLAAGIGAIVIIYSGVRYMTSQDAETTTGARNMILYALTGMVIVFLACPVVDYLVIGTKIVPFTQKCNCFSSWAPSNSTEPPMPRCVDNTPAGQCSASPGYIGYKCILSGSNYILVADSSCGNASSTTSLTTTPTSAGGTSTTTTLADHGMCFNAEKDGLCAGLNVLSPGLKDDCCDEWKCCCTPPSGACTSPG